MAIPPYSRTILVLSLWLKALRERRIFSFLEISFCTFLNKRYHRLLFFSDHKTFRSTESQLLVLKCFFATEPSEAVVRQIGRTALEVLPATSRLGGGR